MNPSPQNHPDLPRTALVLGGGGSAGNAWLIGVIAGLHDGGLDVSDADLIVGTSAGSTAALQITGAPPARLYADIVDAPPRPRPATGGAHRGPIPVDHLARTAAIIAASTGLEDMRRRMGAGAVELLDASDGTWNDQWRATVATRLPSPDWPGRRILITAVDADTGEPVVFDRASGVSPVDAVAASCAGGLPFAIGERRYIDGGYRTNAENADLAAGARRVLVLSPFGGRSRLPQEWGAWLEAQLTELRARGSEVDTIYPDAASLAAFGDNMMDLATRIPAARAGHALGRSLAETLGAFWR
ncbi:patatin-like phospholipase family protein [Leifsonia sp. NPDC058194]|uniref:patatin-like phospholipase family protein n=1 Tax=Leifsonia sp. NPDC058194 TaxID=3346374 RepID=UPI0036DAA64F